MPLLPYLQFPFTAPETLVEAPQAAGVVQNVQVDVLANKCTLDWVVFFSGAAVGGQPIYAKRIELTDAEKDALKARWAVDLLNVLAARDEFSQAGAQVVLP